MTQQTPAEHAKLMKLRAEAYKAWDDHLHDMNTKPAYKAMVEKKAKVQK